MKFNRLLLFTGFLAVLYSCDTSTHHYVSFETDDSAEFWTIVGWDFDSICNTYTTDTTIAYNNVQLLFYKDQSTLNSFPRKVYQLVDTEDGSLDSVLAIEHDFDLTQGDKRVLENDSILVIYRKDKKHVKKQVLYKEMSKSTFWDRVPLPKLH